MEKSTKRWRMLVAPPGVVGRPLILARWNRVHPSGDEQDRRDQASRRRGPRSPSVGRGMWRATGWAVTGEASRRRRPGWARTGGGRRRRDFEAGRPGRLACLEVRVGIVAQRALGKGVPPGPEVLADPIRVERGQDVALALEEA